MTPWAASCAYDNDRVTHNEFKSFLEQFFYHVRFDEIFYKIYFFSLVQECKKNLVKMEKHEYT